MGVHQAIGGAAGKGGKAATPASTNALAQMAQEFAGETKGLRGEMITNFEDILKTGGSQATIPIISKAVEASKRATSQTMSQVEEDLARKGLSGTPFGENVMGQTRMSGNLATSQVPLDITNAFLQMIPGFILGQGQTATQGLGTASGQQTALNQGSMQGIYKSLNLGK